MEVLEAQTMNKKIVKKIIMIISVLVILFGVSYFTNLPQGKETFKSTPIEIETPEPCHKGILTVYDNNNNEVFQYVGTINIGNDGKDGQKIYISVNLDEAGWLK